MTEDIKVTFIIPRNCRTENDCSEEMQLAFTACEQHSGGGLKAQFVHESKYNKFDGLTKKDVFVLDKFDGELYEKLRSTKCLLVGPRCLSCCLMEGMPIPSGPEPVFTVAMRGLVVTASGMSKQQKDALSKKVHWMGGIYNTVLTEDTTHLVSNTVLSDKYIKSIEKGIPVMSESWVPAVWEASLTVNVRGSSSEFDSYKLPPFANLQVTTSGITRKDKQMIMKLVNECGGTFSGAFQSEVTDIVILTKEGIGSEKYKAAVEYGKACVVPAWIKDSAAKGVALPLAKYRVAGASTSSPLAEHRLPDLSLNFSRITNLRPPSNFVDESRAVDVSTSSGKMKLSQDSKRSNDSSIIDKELQSAFENFDMSVIKKAGPIFDGFCIWVTGLEGICRERAAAMVSRCGGVRYDCPHERVTHAVAGTKAAASNVGVACPNIPVLTPLWLLKSVVEGRALEEVEFVIDAKPATPLKSGRKPDIEPSSPMSKRNIQLLRRVALRLPPPPPAPQLPEPQNDDIVNHYLSQVMEPEPIREKTPERPAPITTLQQQDVTEVDEPTDEVEQIFAGIKIEVQGLDEEAIMEIGAEIAAAGGVLLASGGRGSHVLVPLDFDGESVDGAEAVTVFWVKDCLSQQELLPIQYYHRPVKLPQWSSGSTLPLEGVVASLSTYSGVERAFLDELAKLLGATTQLRFCRRNTANAQASTHLICPTPTGDKYLGAVKWGLPAVKASWLLACAQDGRRVSEREHLVGDTKAPPSPEEPPEVPEHIPEDRQANIQTDKENAMLPPAPSAVPRRGSVPGSREQTPKNKGGLAVDDMSPASRYIAMARQGLLGGDSQETPKTKRVLGLNDDDRPDGEVRTPPLDDALSTPNLRGLSPTTRRRLQAVKRGEMPSDPIRTPVDPFEKNPDTPDSAFGAALRPGSGRLSPDSRKRLWKVVQDLPSKECLPLKEKHTPLSEIRNRFLAQFNGDAPTPPSEHTLAPRKLHLEDQADTPPAKIAKTSIHQSASGGITTSDIDETARNPTNSTKSSISSASSVLPAVDAQLQRLSAALSSRLSSQRVRRSVQRDSITIAPSTTTAAEQEAGPESQPNTVGWDDTTPHPPGAVTEPTPATKRFMLSSNVDNREEIIEMIQYLGGEVCDGAELDPEATHLLCAAPGRSEKMLGSVAAGRWVLHPAYIPRSRVNGRFVTEEEYEWGNPLATCLPSLTGAEHILARAAYRWRSNRASGRPGPFTGVVALLHVPPARKRLLQRLVIAGDGQAPDLEPPYNDESITVCFADVKRYPLSSRDASWLASHRVPVCAPVLLSSYLTDDTPPRPIDHCLPDYRPK
ncbi:DNA topoisomerase 2-binding protein 1-A [Plodia interpunctella]|uniref:DNA topoisomerase 2-binding protein 1-A n=1 Tax=Plodia interpunctella TaxID=58824 RepID=UPI00236749F6|nr:DNA topoisomerase 2-binding protein 1-A [Plodia interpunctella]XP_053601890.1 DNA topoisomerase 2-binding protein 1-A [Plodia interpunctella]